jgi:hypothetical protein
MSTANKLPRRDARLKNLTEAQQERILAAVKAGKDREKEIIPWIKSELGVRTSTGALSDFLSWYVARMQSRADEQAVLAQIDSEAALHPEWTKEFLWERGQRRMEMITIARQDPDAWAKIQKTARDKENSEQSRTEFRRETCELFLEWSQNEKAKAIASSNSTHEEKLKALDQAMFPEDWAK